MDEPVCKSVELQLFYAVLDGRECAFGRTEAEAREALESSYHFGEPVEEDDLCKSGHWTQGPDDHGWRIVARMQTVFFAAVLFAGDRHKNIFSDEFGQNRAASHFGKQRAANFERQGIEQG